MGESSETIRKRVQAARDIQRERLGIRSLLISERQSRETLRSDIVCNSDMHLAEIRKFFKLQDESQNLTHSAMNQLNLSARAYHRILKLARTIADLAGSEDSSPRIWQRHCGIGRS